MFELLAIDSVSEWTVVGLLSGLLVVLLVFLVDSSTMDVLLNRPPRRRLPPGPLLNRLPVFGSLPLFLRGQPAYEVFARLARHYGPIFRVRLGSRTMVVISDHKLFREAFKREDMTDRPHMPLNDGLMDGYGTVRYARDETHSKT